MNTPLNEHNALNHWTDKLARLIRPLELGEFDLTPILRARYGNLLREGVVTVRLFAENEELVLIAEEVGRDAPIIVEFSRTMIVLQAGEEPDDLSYLAGLFFYGFEQPAPDRLAPPEARQAWFQEMFPQLLMLCDSHEFAPYLNIFTPHYVALLERTGDRMRRAVEDRFDKRRFEQGVAFFRDCTESLVEHIHAPVRERLIQQIAAKLQVQPAFEILSSELKTYWDEIGVIAEEGSDNLLYWTLMDDLDALAAKAINELAPVERFALWAGCEEGASWFDTYTDDSFPKDMSEADINVDDMAADIRNTLLGQAMDTLSQEARDYLGY